MIISSDNYHKNRQDVIIVAVTSNTKRVLFGDTRIEGWKEAGLIYPSLVTGIMRTIKESMVIHKLGILSQQDFQKVRDNIRKTIGI